MTGKEAKAMLEQITDLTRLIKQIEDAYSSSAPITLPDGVTIAGSDLLQVELAKCADSLINQKQQALQAINKMGDIRFKALLISRYFNGNEWETIASDFDVTKSVVAYQWLKDALEEFAKNYERTVKTDVQKETAGA